LRDSSLSRTPSNLESPIIIAQQPDWAMLRQPAVEQRLFSARPASTSRLTRTVLFCRIAKKLDPHLGATSMGDQPC
jgi:hypothetical protein